MHFRIEKVYDYAQASTVPSFRWDAGPAQIISYELMLSSAILPLRNVKVTVPDVVGVQVNVDDLPAVTVKPGVVVGGFDVDPDCAATATSRHPRTESGVTRILSVATECLK